MSRWKLDTDTGLWSVDEANDYVLNGSFEADRVSVGEQGYRDKDGNVSADIAGWQRVNPDAVKNVADAYGRVGDFDLRFAPGQSRSAAIVQDFDEPGHVPLHAGRFLLKLSYANPKGMDEARIAIEFGGKTSEINLAASTGTDWKQASLPVDLPGGHTKITIEVSGSPGQTLHVDDVSLKGVSEKGNETNDVADHDGNGTTTGPGGSASGSVESDKSLSVRPVTGSSGLSSSLAATGIAIGHAPVFVASCVAAGILLMVVAVYCRRRLIEQN